MPRALAVRYLDVPDAARGAYRARLAERAASARACGYHLWAFEREGAWHRGRSRQSPCSDQLSSVFLTNAMNRSASAPSTIRWSNDIEK